MEAQPGPGGRLSSLLVESASGSRVARERLEQVVRGADHLGLVRVLSLPAVPPQDEIGGARRELLAPQRLLSAPADGELALGSLATADDGGCDRLRFVDRRYRLRLEADSLARAVELRRIDRTGKHDADVDARTFFLQLHRALSKNVRSAAFVAQYAACKGMPR